MSDLESQNRHSLRSSIEKDPATVRLEERRAIQEELGKVKEQIDRLHDKLERTIYKNGLLLTLNCHLMEELQTASTSSTQGYKVRNLIG